MNPNALNLSSPEGKRQKSVHASDKILKNELKLINTMVGLYDFSPEEMKELQKRLNSLDKSIVNKTNHAIRHQDRKRIKKINSDRDKTFREKSLDNDADFAEYISQEIYKLKYNGTTTKDIKRYIRRIYKEVKKIKNGK